VRILNFFIDTNNKFVKFLLILAILTPLFFHLFYRVSIDKNKVLTLYQEYEKRRKIERIIIQDTINQAIKTTKNLNQIQSEWVKNENQIKTFDKLYKTKLPKPKLTDQYEFWEFYKDLLKTEINLVLLEIEEFKGKPEEELKKYINNLINKYHEIDSFLSYSQPIEKRATQENKMVTIWMVLSSSLCFGLAWIISNRFTFNSPFKVTELKRENILKNKEFIKKSKNRDAEIKKTNVDMAETEVDMANAKYEKAKVKVAFADLQTPKPEQPRQKKTDFERFKERAKKLKTEEKIIFIKNQQKEELRNIDASNLSEGEKEQVKEQINAKYGRFMMEEL